MGQPRPSYSEILAEVGKAWDLENADAGMAITLLDQLKSTIQGNVMDLEKKDILLELIDVSTQFITKDEGTETVLTPSSTRKRFSASPSSGFEGCLSSRLRIQTKTICGTRCY